MSRWKENPKRSHRGLPLDERGMDAADRKIELQRINRERVRQGLPKLARIGTDLVESAEQEDARLLRAELERLRKAALDHAAVREQIIRVTHSKPPVPAWLVTPPGRAKSTPGVPSLFLSDLHWGERVDPAQIGQVNSYDLKIARQRLRTVVNGTVALLRDHMVNPNYPGIVVPLGGDMLSGNIHEELAKSNEKEVMPCLLDLLGAMIWAITTLADEFGAVFCPCVTGNHGRNTQKIQAKDRHHTSFDWLLYQFLDLHFQDDARVTFQIPDGPDAYFRIYDHRYLLTHGDQLGKGGDGIIGFYGPVVRGDHRRRSRGAEIGQDYETLLVGHWHQLVMAGRFIANGSLKGYDEFASGLAMPFQRPLQACWITHPTRGITFQFPIQAEATGTKVAALDWVSVPKGKATA